MGREQFRTPDEDVAAEFDRVCQLFRLALGKPSDRVLFDSLMVEASEQGLNWVQGLEYVIQRRKAENPEGSNGSSHLRKAASSGDVDGDLRRAG